MASQELRLPCQKGVAWSWWPPFRAGQLRQSCQIRLLRVGVWEQLYSFLFRNGRGEGKGGGSGRARALNCRRQAGVTTGNPKIDFHSYRVAGQPWAPCVSQKPECPPLGPFLVGMGPFWKGQGFEISMRELNCEPLSWFGSPLFWGSKKHQSVNIRKSNKSPSGSTKNACRLTYHVLRMCLLPGKSVHRKKANMFSKF